MSGYSDFDAPGETTSFGTFVVSAMPGRDDFRVVSRPERPQGAAPYAVAVSKEYKLPALTEFGHYMRVAQREGEKNFNEQQRQQYLQRSKYIESTGFRLLQPGGKVILPNGWLTIPEALKSMGDSCTVENFCGHYGSSNPNSPARQFHGVTVVPANDEWMRTTREHARADREAASERESKSRKVQWGIVKVLLCIAALPVAFVLFLTLLG